MAELSVGVWRPFKDAQELVAFTCGIRARTLDSAEGRRAFFDSENQGAACVPAASAEGEAVASDQKKRSGSASRAADGQESRS